MGEVYEATDTTTQTSVALKLMRVRSAEDTEESSHEWEVRFEREVRAIRGLESPHVVRVHDSGVDSSTGDRFLVMELLDGEDLAELQKRLGPLPVDTALRLVAQTCLGLERAHAAGVVHRDIKPGNLFLTREAEKRSVRILDFGIARVGGGGDDADLTELTRTGSMLGSPLYMAPEQARGSKGVDIRADVWSLGVVLYRLLSNTLPHTKGDGGLGELLIAICCEPAPAVQSRAPWVPPAVAEIVHRALSIDRTKRFASVREMYQAIVDLLPNGSVEIDDAMLVPLDASERDVVAPSAGISSLTPAGSSLPARDGREPGSETNAAVSATPRGRAPVPKGRTLALVGLAGVVAALLVVFVGVKLGASSRPSTASPLPSVASPAVITASLEVPEGATIEVDGAVVTNVAGRVELRGIAGAVRAVKVKAGAGELVADVVLSERGAHPSALTLPAAPALPAAASTNDRAPASSVASPRPAARPVAAQPRPRETSAASSASKLPPAPATGGLRTDFE